jgi:hypothetical protein
MTRWAIEARPLGADADGTGLIRVETRGRVASRGIIAGPTRVDRPGVLGFGAACGVADGTTTGSGRLREKGHARLRLGSHGSATPGAADDGRISDIRTTPQGGFRR